MVSVWSPHWKTQMGYPCTRSLLFKAYDHGLALQAAFGHLFNLSSLCPSLLSSSIEKSRFASLFLSLPLFEAVRRMTIMRPGGSPPLHTHTNIHTSNTRNTDDTIKCRNTQVCHSTHSYLHTHMQCEMNAGSHKILFVQICHSFNFAI